MEWITEPFSLAFQQRALMGGTLAATALALVGTWVVVRGMAFLGDALVHGVIPGIALALILGFNLGLGAVLAAGVMMLGINLVHRQAVFSEDTGIGLLFVGMLGLGVILISMTDSYAGNLAVILFGDALGVTMADIRGLLVITGLTLVISVVLYRPFLALSFNEQKARLLGLHPKLAHFALLGLMTLAIVGSVRTVGAMLVLGLLVGPPASAILLARRLPSIMGTSVLVGVASVAVGLIISYHANTSGSATMAVVPVVFFFVVLGVRSTVERLRRAGAATSQ